MEHGETIQPKELSTEDRDKLSWLWYGVLEGGPISLNDVFRIMKDKISRTKKGHGLIGKFTSSLKTNKDLKDGIFYLERLLETAGLELVSGMNNPSTHDLLCFLQHVPLNARTESTHRQAWLTLQKLSTEDVEIELFLSVVKAQRALLKEIAESKPVRQKT